MDNKKLYVGNLPWTLTNDSLKEMFAQFGEVTEAVIITDRMSGRSKGFGFVTFATEEAAAAATQQMNEKEIEGRKIVVNVARPREERRPGGGGGFRSGGGGGGYRDDRRSY
ncbi:MAG: RNA-binding protein [Patescibacteria group bacterium]